MPSNINSNSKRGLANNRDVSDIPTAFKFGNDFAPSMGVLLVALLAMLTMQVFRYGHSRYPQLMFAEAIAFAALPWIAYSILYFKLKKNSKFSFSKTNIIRFQLGALFIAILVVLWHITIRQFGHGDANEILALLIIQSVSWYLAVFSKVPGFEKASSVLSSALVFFVCCIDDDVKIFLPATLFAFVGLWWLLGQYWSRLESKAIDGNSRFLKLHGSAVSLTTLIIVLVACLAAAVPFAQSKISLAGFSPFSGGERGSEHELAISGIGDGNMLTAGNNATTTGAVESDEFIEDHQRSLYDITAERYEGPVMKNPRNRTIPLTAKAKHLHKVKQSEQAGRTFRTMRNSDATTNIELDDRITEALFFLEGSVPARLAINSFSQFDGWDWSNVPPDSKSASPLAILLNDPNGTPIFSFAQTPASYLTGRRSHCVKIMRLESKTIPSPALLQEWHIPNVSNPRMFRWGDADLIEIDGDSIPTHAIIGLESLVPNYHLLREFESPQPTASGNGSQETATGTKDSRFLQVPKTVSRPIVQKLADQWTEGVKPGWLQVETIVSRLRNEFSLDPDWETSEQVEDSVNHFLNQGGGPSYMFTTTCAMALRSAGYKTRVASGFLVQKQDYDSRVRQSIVTSGNLHMWPEVCLDGQFWLPVEPTPGFPIPYSTQTSWQWITAKAATVWSWLLSNPLTVLSVAAFCTLAILFRAEWITSFLFGWWFLVRVFWPQGLLKTTRQLIDLRFWFSGDRRPASQTINAWYSRIEADATSTFLRLWNAENYSDNTESASRQELAMTCQQILSSLSLKRIRDFNAIANTTVIHDTEI